MKTRIFYMLCIRHSDADQWGEPEAFTSRKERDRAAAFNRIIGGLRTYSYQERRAIAVEPTECEASGDDLRERVAK